MSRDPYAKALRVKPQQVISDKRERLTIRALWDETANEPLPDDFNELLDQLPEDSVCSQPNSSDQSTNATGATPKGPQTN